MLVSGQTETFFLLALSIASIAWTVTNDEIFLRSQEIFAFKNLKPAAPYRNTSYSIFLPVNIVLVIMLPYYFYLSQNSICCLTTGGYLVGGFALVWIANIYMSLYGSNKSRDEERQEMMKNVCGIPKSVTLRKKHELLKQNLTVK
ncbi:hypothetical protein BH11BAC1_BH11BAC1_03730 [soil metagenome]